MSTLLLSVQKGSSGPASTLISCKLLFVLGLPARLQGIPRLPHPRCCGAGELWLLLLACADEGPGGAGSRQPPLSQHGNNGGVRGRVVEARGARHAWPCWLLAAGSIKGACGCLVFHLAGKSVMLSRCQQKYQPGTARRANSGCPVVNTVGLCHSPSHWHFLPAEYGAVELCWCLVRASQGAPPGKAPAEGLSWCPTAPQHGGLGMLQGCAPIPMEGGKPGSGLGTAVALHSASLSASSGSDTAPYHPYFIACGVFLACPTLAEEALSREQQALPWAHAARETK